MTVTCNPLHSEYAMAAKRRKPDPTLHPFKWREAEVITLLKLYKQYSCLWDTKNPEYKNRYIREKAYIRIIQGLGFQAEALNITVADVRKKIKGLRTTYNDELRKVAKSIKNGAKGGDVHQPSVFWFPLADSFLKEVADTRRDASLNKAPRRDIETIKIEDEPFTNVSLPESQDQDEDEGEYADTSGNDHNHQQPIVHSGWSFNNDHQYFEISAVTSSSPEISKENKNSQDGTTKGNEDEYFEITDVTSTALKRKEIPEINIEQEKSDDRSTKEDEIDLFGRSVVMQLRKLPEMARLKVMQDFHKILIDARMASSSTSSNVDSYPSISAVYSVTGIKQKLTNMLSDIYNQDPLNTD